MPFPKIKTNSLRFKDFRLNQKTSHSVKITSELVKEFAKFSGDRNPIHMSDEYAKKNLFKERVAHGFLISTFLSSIYANSLPGEGTILLEQNLKFVNPVFLNEEITYNLKIIKIFPSKKILKIQVRCLTNRKEVVNGVASFMHLN